jgi:hypothetical protein
MMTSSVKDREQNKWTVDLKYRGMKGARLVPGHPSGRTPRDFNTLAILLLLLPRPSGSNAPPPGEIHQPGARDGMAALGDKKDKVRSDPPTELSSARQWQNS